MWFSEGQNIYDGPVAWDSTNILWNTAQGYCRNLIAWNMLNPNFISSTQNGTGKQNIMGRTCVSCLFLFLFCSWVLNQRM